jgi:phosphoglycolate phosphatase
MRSYIKALIFDLDGTLADTIPAITEAVNMTLTELGFPNRDQIEIKSYIGKGPRHLITESLPKESVIENPQIIDQALALYDKMYAKTYFHTNSLYDGMEEAIITLSKYYKIAVLSNKQDEYVKHLVKQLLPNGICEIARGTVAGKPAKPDPAVALEMLEQLGVSNYECILIGDSEIDILTAKNAEMECLSVTWGYASKTKLIMKGAQGIVNSPAELIDYFK